MTEWIEAIAYVIAAGGAVMGYMIFSFDKYAYLGPRRKMMAAAVVVLGFILSLLFLLVSGG